MINLPIIHYSVEWWNTLHQGPPSPSLTNPPSPHDAVGPLLIMILAFAAFLGALTLMRFRNELLMRGVALPLGRRHRQAGEASGMHFASFSDFLAMGGYAFYVWLSFGLTLLCLVGIVISTRLKTPQPARRTAQQAGLGRPPKAAQQMENTP